MSNIKKIWPCFDPQHEGLPAIVGNAQWQIIPHAQEMRNKLVHGIRVYELDKCRENAEKMLFALEAIRQAFEQRYGFSGWSTLSVRKKSALHKDPKVIV
jgi:hypothetical protein